MDPHSFDDTLSLGIGLAIDPLGAKTTIPVRHHNLM
jgi:hypothetical protein